MVSELGSGEKLAGLLALEPLRSNLSETQFAHLQKEMIRLFVNLAGYTFSKSDLLLLLNNAKSLSRAYRVLHDLISICLCSLFYPSPFVHNVLPLWPSFRLLA